MGSRQKKSRVQRQMDRQGEHLGPLTPYQEAVARNEDYAEIWQNPVGRRVLLDILHFAGVFGALAPDDCDPHRALKADGMRRVGMHIVGILGQDHAHLVALAAERPYHV